jgi:hypothetical protein
MCSPGDVLAMNACALISGQDGRVVTRIVPWEAGHADWAKKINAGFEETTEDFLLLGATDLRFHPGWDANALRVAKHTGAGVIGTNDLGNVTVMRGKHSTHPLVRRAYIEQFGTVDEPGKVVHEGYQHQWVDTELVQTAMARGQWAFAKDSHVEHLHFMWRKSKRDATYDKALSTSREDHHYFSQRKRLIDRERKAVISAS